jgi:hypothetical protein
MKDYGSKKKKRYMRFLERENKRKQEKISQESYSKIMRTGNIEEMAKAMGIKLR